MDALPDGGLRLSSQSAGIGGYGYKLAMLVIPARRVVECDRDLQYSWNNSVAHSTTGLP
jgi:hypothetical protein